MTSPSPCFLTLTWQPPGDEESAYGHYAELIRHEYHFVERSAYCEKRAESTDMLSFGELKIFASAPMPQASRTSKKEFTQRD
jgi:predicted metal-dependent HD superfamily phosphohydrolase